MDVRRAFAAAVLVTCSAAASAQGPFKPRPEKDPYRSLFAASVRPPQPDQTLRVQEPARQEPVVVCSMRIIPIDPQVDPKMNVAPPADVEHRMRVITPAGCQPK